MIFSIEEQLVIIGFLHLCGVTPIKIHLQLSETCSDGIMNMNIFHLWVWKFKEARTNNEPKQLQPRTSRTDNMITWVEQMDCQLGVSDIVTKTGVSIGYVYTILYEYLKIWKCLHGGCCECWLTTTKNKAVRVTICQVILTRNDSAFSTSVVTMDVVFQSWNEVAVGTMQVHWLTTTEEISGYHQCEENDGDHILGQWRPNSNSLYSKRHYSDGCILQTCFTDEVPSSIASKMARKGCTCTFPSR